MQEIVNSKTHALSTRDAAKSAPTAVAALKFKSARCPSASRTQAHSHEHPRTARTNHDLAAVFRMHAPLGRANEKRQRVRPVCQLVNVEGGVSDVRYVRMTDGLQVDFI